MSLVKRDISKNISSKAQISLSDSKKILDTFIGFIQDSNNIVKISNFGVFNTKVTPKRLGRNPKTKQTYIIVQRNKRFFRASNYIKKLIN